MTCASKKCSRQKSDQITYVPRPILRWDHSPQMEIICCEANCIDRQIAKLSIFGTFWLRMHAISKDTSEVEALRIPS